MKRNALKLNQNPAAAVAYIRVSTEDQTLGPDAQRAALTAWAQRAGVEIVAWFEDRGVSGVAAIDRRPGLLAAIDALAEHGAGLLAVAKRDRLARDVVAAAMIERMAERVGARVTSAAGEGEGDDPASKLMRTMIDAFAQYEAAIIKARTRAALQVKKTRGEVWNGSLPYGTTRAADGAHVEADADEAKVVAAIRDLAAAGWTCRAIAAELDRRGVVNRAGRPLHFTAVARIARAA